MTTNRSNSGDRVVRYVAVYASGKMKQRAVRSPNARAPWESGAAWGRAGAHAMPEPSPGTEAAPIPKAKNPAKVAAGKARAAKAAAAKLAAANGKAAPAVKSKRKPKPASPMKSTAKALSAAAKKKPAKRERAEPSGDAMVVVAFRATAAQKRKFGKLGGGEWARKRIDAANL